MADRANAISAEHSVVAKSEVDASPPLSEIDSSMQSGEAPIGSLKVSPKQCTEDSGDERSAKPGKDMSGTPGKGAPKSTDNEVFIPAPPPVTNAWTKRMQASCAAAGKSAAESTSVKDKNAPARLPADANKPAPTKKQPSNFSPTDQWAKTDPNTSQSRLDSSSMQEEDKSSASVEQPSAESWENPSLKPTADVQSTSGGEALSKVETQARSLPASDTVPASSCWKKPVGAAPVQSVGETSIVQSSAATKQQGPTDISTGELRL